MSIDTRIISVLDQINDEMKTYTRGGWTPNTDYEVGDPVSYQYGWFACTTKHRSTSLFNPEYWTHYGLYSFGSFFDPTLSEVIFLHANV